MTTKSTIHSAAFNFLSAVTTGVDSRTGQYSCGLSLPELTGNDLAGPQVPLRLGFNPLNTLDSGYGLGWTLQLSQFDTETDVLSLASGETFKYTSDSSSDDQLLMEEKKLDSFRLHKLSETRFRVVHKSGLIEELTTAGDDPVALPEVMYSPQGHKVTLDYVVYNDGRMLRSVIDGDGSVILEVTRQSASVQVLLYPRTAHETLFSLILEGSEHRVGRIQMPTDNFAGWRFQYQTWQGLQCISRVEGPLGGSEQIYYDDGEHLFPGPGERRLPRVHRHLQDPGPGQPVIETRYDYSAENFLGYNAPGLSWEDNGLDNLYKITSNYTYWTREHLWDEANSRPLRTVERVFNRFHLITDETTTQGDCVKWVKSEYHIRDGEKFIDQPAQCQLPSKVTTTWYRASETGRSREDVVLSAFDEHGNQTLQVQANGVREESEYYPAAGGDGCPADPHGFVRHLKQKTVRPAPDGHDGAPTLRTEYRYVAQPPIAGGSHEWLAQDLEILVDADSGVELQRTRQSYINQPNDAFQHGRVAKTEVILAGKGTFTDFFYSKALARRAGETVLRTVESLSTSFDTSTKTITRERSLLNGQPLLELDDNDVEIAYRYDRLGRVIEETVAPDTLYAAKRTYEYVLVAQTGGRASQTMTDVKQVKTRSTLDGLQRVVLEERQDVDGDPLNKPFRAIASSQYDAFGQLLESREIDWLGAEDMSLPSTYTYDDWGEQASVTGPDGVTEHSLNDPINFEVQQWRDGMGRTVTRNNRFEKPDRVERIDLAGQRLSLYEYFYDGLGRTHHEFDELQHFRYYLYDAFDRMTLSGLPDSAEVERRYAEHSAEDLPTWIAVRDGNGLTVLGEQTFDGLERLVSAVTGGRERTYQFKGGERQPASVTTHSGQVIEYEYNLHLGEDPVQRRMPGMQADYEYDRDNARLTFSEENGQTLNCTYYSNGELKSETRGSDGQSYAMSYDYSLRGRLLGYTDAFGQEQRNHYDGHGRLELTTLGGTSSVFSYNTAGQVSRILTRDEDEGHSVQIDLEYDDFAREILRTFTFDDGSVQTLAQAYNPRDMLERRTLHLGATLLRDEHYGYDPRGRLVDYRCTGDEPPLDPYGKAIDRQEFEFDALDNMTRVRTWFPGGDNVALYEYGGDDPTQLTAVKNSHQDYPALIALSYDDDGNLTTDDQGRTLAYDALGRLTTVSEAGRAPLEYRYDAQDILSGSLGEEGAEQRFYREGELVNQLQEGGQRTFMRGGDTLLAERIGDAANDRE